MANVVQIIFQVDPNGTGAAAIVNINHQIQGLGQFGQQAGAQLGTGLSAVSAGGALAAAGIGLVVEGLRQGIKEAYEFGKTAVAAFNEANNAALGLQTVSKSVGVDPSAALDAVKNLDLVKKGLLTTGEASTALKNLLRTGFSLEQSISLIEKFGDTAAFNKQSAIAYGEAVVRTTEGIRQNLSTLADAGGITTNLSVIQEKAGITFDELGNKATKAGAATKYYNEFVKETAPFLGDAARKAETFAGGQDRLAAAQQKVLVTVGKLITENPALNDSFHELGKSLEIVNNILKDSDSELNQLVKAGTTTFAALVRGSADFLSSLEGILGVIRDLVNINTLGVSNGIFGALFPKQDAATADILDKAKKFNEAFNEARRVKPSDGGDSRALFKATNKDLEALQKFVKQSEENFKKFETSVKESGDAVQDLQSKLSTNPLLNLFDAAERRQRDFITKFNEVPDAIKAAFEKANRDVLQLELFKGVLGQGAGINNLLNEIAKLEAGFGGKKNLTAADEERFGGIQSSFVDKQIATAQSLLEKADSAQQRALANQSIIGATGDIRNLSPAQVEARLKALNDQLVLEQAAFQENFNRLTAQTNATTTNTAALIENGNRLAAVEGALTNFKESALSIKIENDSTATVDLGSG